MPSTTGRIDIGALSAEVEFEVVTNPDSTVTVHARGVRLLLRKAGGRCSEPPVEIGYLARLTEPDEPGTPE